MFISLFDCRAIIVRLSSIIVLIITLFILIRCSQAVNDTTDEQTCRFNLNTILGTTANGINSTTECTEVRALVTLPTYYTNQPTPSPPLLTPSFSLHSLILSFLPHAVLGDFYWAGVLQAGSHQFCCDSTQHNRGGNIAAVSSFTIPLPLPITPSLSSLMHAVFSPSLEGWEQKLGRAHSIFPRAFWTSSTHSPSYGRRLAPQTDTVAPVYLSVLLPPLRLGFMFCPLLPVVILLTTFLLFYIKKVPRLRAGRATCVPFPSFCSLSTTVQSHLEPDTRQASNVPCGQDQLSLCVSFASRSLCHPGACRSHCV